MKNLDLNAYGVNEMSHQEMVETDGGGIITGLVIAAIIIVGAVSSSCTYAPDQSKTINVNVQVNNDSTSNQQQGGGTSNVGNRR